ncbi:MAG: cysteine desulfurase [Gomphosphaeria aponina SAG 52.96 = DSM 107014]|uniref:Cysteine desulfurase n=1 Tax=Gomphosphaeria aponina SAG 52.96 = DSM 107014 TaxID=1521640 RepID=A0A941GPX7_9CHRO|nr:cysteine desulfurase [Gomphosphaeria aponina SAG 52.96 = DSM 107014]
MPSIHQKSHPIYLDYHSTTPVDPRVAEKMVYYMTTAFGNASSIDHVYGDEAEAAVNEAAGHVARLINAKPKEIIFTSGATESINLVLQGLVGNNGRKTSKIVTTKLEHQAVLDTCAALAKKGWAEIVFVEVDGQGRIYLEQLEKVVQGGVSLLCFMAANNEIGNIYPLEKIGKIAQEYGIPFFCDASQAVGKIPLNFAEWGINYLAISAHKFYGPKGCGALVVNKKYELEPMIYGGGHQGKMRSGTLNVPGIVGLGTACSLRELEMVADEKAIAFLRNRLQTLLQANITDLVINGDLEARLSGNLHIAIPGIPNSAIIARIRSQLAISTGAACSSGVETPSHVLQALGLASEIIEGALRLGIGKFTTVAEIETAAEILIHAVRETRKRLRPLVSNHNLSS